MAHDPDAARYADTAQHVARCDTCRREFERSQHISRCLRSVPPTIHSEQAPHLSHHDIARYVDEPSALGRGAWQAHLEQCGECMGEVMLYRTRKRASSARAARAPRDELRAGDSGQVTWYRRRVPVWGAASGAIAAGLIIAIGIGPLLSDGSKSPRITTYRDDPHIYFSPMPAGGLGFFSDASTKPEAFNGVSVAIDGPALTLAWPPIRQSTTYTLNLFYYDGRDHTALQRFVSDAPSVSIERNLLQSGKRYEWVLSGVDQDGEYFTAQGGFILTD